MLLDKLMLDCLRIIYLVKSRGFGHLATLGLVNDVALRDCQMYYLGLTNMHKAGYSGEARFVLHVPSSSCHHKLESND